MFTLEESALLGRMLRALAVMGLCTIGGAGYLLLRPFAAPRQTPVAAPAQPSNGPSHQASHRPRLRPHQTRHPHGTSSALSL
jgi:hypothetical protein